MEDRDQRAINSQRLKVKIESEIKDGKINEEREDGKEQGDGDPAPGDNITKPKFVHLFRMENEELVKEFIKDYKENINVQKIYISKEEEKNVFWIYSKLSKISSTFFKKYKGSEHIEPGLNRAAQFGFIKDKGPLYKKFGI